MPTDMEGLRHTADNGISRVSLRDTKIVVPIVLVTSLCAVAGRVYLKLQHRRKLAIDDYFLLFGTVCFIAATGLYYSMVDDVYISLLVGTDPSLIALLSPADQITLSERMLRMLKTHAAFHFLVSTTLLMVKMGFLHFIRKAVLTRPRLYVFWKITVLITIIFSIFLMLIPFMACPHFVPSSLLKCQGPAVLWKIDFLSYLGFATDSITNLLIVVIPLLLIHNQKADSRQKITVAIFLSLTSIMIFVSIVRIGTLRTHEGLFDYTWTNLWSHVEAGVAVIMGSLNAFRTQFILRKEERQRRENMRKPQIYKPSKRQAPWLESEDEKEPSDSGGTMIALETILRRQSAIREPSSREGLCRKNPGLSVDVLRPDSMYQQEPDSDPFITSPSWFKATHLSSPVSSV
ncbi:hypothetical protein K504DRAFT_466522 [Pleomassaria siparia CBS 279.74]|uniref:Rhodopsin domain-containing protein n=1 Tax=Pleomassaria siparia CBS 279.74 TaxID=1314801 RepID=A0A6G1KC98_9PLEO|nr:hypothetical protein K504DRAFT_466522 [Pleomassaria siparia CBS 279.74]